MDQQARKKKRERFFLESFLAVSGIDATISNARDERPDADIEVAGRLVGVEITELFIDVRPKRNSALSHEEFAQRQESHHPQVASHQTPGWTQCRSQCAHCEYCHLLFR